MKFKGCIVEESLEDKENLEKIKSLEIVKIRKTKEENEIGVWHIYNVFIEEKDIDKLLDKIKAKWYMHFWNKNKIIVIFKNKKFEFNINNNEEREKAVNYGLSLGILEEQLDFKEEF